MKRLAKAGSQCSICTGACIGAECPFICNYTANATDTRIRIQYHNPPEPKSELPQHGKRGKYWLPKHERIR